jgi:periplasmic protein TonB
MHLSRLATTPVPQPQNRRQHRRRKPDELTYIDLGPDNGGLLTDAGEGGLAFEGIVALEHGQIVEVEFHLPGMSGGIHAKGQFVWADDSRRGGGLRFVELAEDARRQLREWAAHEMRAQIPPASHADGIREQDSQTSVNADWVHALAAKLEIPLMEGLPSPPAESAEATSIASLEPAQDPGVIDRTPLPSKAGNPLQHPTIPATAAKVRAAAPALPIESAPPANGGNGHVSTTVQTGGAAAALPPKKPAVELKSSAVASLPALTPAKGQETHEPALVREASASASKPTSSAPVAAAHVASAPSRTPHIAVQKLPTVKTEKKVGRKEKESFRLDPQILQFTAGLATGCLAMAAVAGGLVATGRLHVLGLNATSPSTLQASANPGGKGFQLEVLSLDGQRRTMTMPAGRNAEIAPTPVQREAARVSAPSPAPLPDVPAPAETHQRVSLRVRSATAAESVKSIRSSTAHPNPTNLPRLAVQPTLQRPHVTAAVAGDAANVQAPPTLSGITPALPAIETRAPVAVAPPAEQKQEAAIQEPAAIFPAPELEAAPAPRAGPKATKPAPSAVFPSPVPEAAHPSVYQPAKLIERIAPVYPAAARAQAVQGSVQILATVGKDGVLRDVVVVRGDGRLAAAALSAIARWRYRPATLYGQPVESQVTINVAFRP